MERKRDEDKWQVYNTAKITSSELLSSLENICSHQHNKHNAKGKDNKQMGGMIETNFKIKGGKLVTQNSDLILE